MIVDDYPFNIEIVEDLLDDFEINYIKEVCLNG